MIHLFEHTLHKVLFISIENKKCYWFDYDCADILIEITYSVLEDNKSKYIKIL